MNERSLMTIDDAEKIISIMLESDGHCPRCSAELLVKFCTAYPQTFHLADEAFHRKYRWRLKAYRERFLS